MKVLVIGSGGREHALAWKLSQSPQVDRVFIAPGNAGTSLEGENVDISATDIPQLIQFAKKNQIGLTVVGPEQPLVEGIVDAFQKEKLSIFGPSKAAAEIEGSKVFCKNMLRQANVPSAEFKVFTDVHSAVDFIGDRHESRWVVKVDGLAAGKGVFVCRIREEAIEAIERILVHKEFGEAGARIVIEERLEGEEASILAITDGKTLITLPACQDHKRAYDNDMGPNTGGMGAYCPTPLIKPEMIGTIEQKILIPTIHTMKREKRPFRGILYAGLMLTAHGPKVLEYNARFGDPECQPLLMRLKSDLCELLLAVAKGTLDQIQPPEWDPRPAICVVMASEGYPGKYVKGKVIRGLEAAAEVPNVKVFHAGTTRVNGEIVTDGGRVLGVTALGENISGAKLAAYTAVKAIRWDGAWCRKDISDKALRYTS